MAEQQHRATADEWACVKEYNSEISFSCLLELLHRIESLEAAAKPNYQADSSLLSQVSEVAAAAGMPAQPNHPEIPGSSLERRVSEHIRAQSVLTAALVKRLEALEGMPPDGAVPAKVPGGLPALAEKVKELEDTVNATTHPAKPDSSLVGRVAAAIVENSEPGVNWEPEARAAIREVAAWLRKHKQFGAAVWSQSLKEEAER